MINRETGTEIVGFSAYVQGFRHAMRTPIGSRYRRRSYGSRLPDMLVSQTNTAYNRRLLQAAILDAYYDPANQLQGDFELEKVTVEPTDNGVRFIISGRYLGKRESFGL